MAKSKDKKKKLKKRALLASGEKRVNARKPGDADQKETSKAAAAGTGVAGPSEGDGA
jgi:hypothetical protein